ncbi:MAG: DUF6110 family protein [Lachnospiraceae bacterium]|nr:DUF6110 family protein [Lachnospiraceae bacterium]MDO5550770.1 DUF6110 family protein [Lachnospiraceae bacterium]
MLECFKEINVKKTGIFAAGVLFGTAGIKLLSSKDAKKFYTNCTAAVLRAKDCVMKTATTIQENAEDIYAEAQQINEERAAMEDVVEDDFKEVVTEDDEEAASEEEAADGSEV